MSDFSDRLWSKGFLPIPGEPWTLEDHDKVRVLQDRIAELEADIADEVATRLLANERIAILSELLTDKCHELKEKHLTAENERYREALKEITKLGAVCENFELCKHKPCNDSAGAVLVALEALSDAFQEER